MLVELNIEPGIIKDIPPYAAKGRWIDGNKVRFRSGKVLSIGGWENAFPGENYLGKARSMLEWYDNSGNQLLGIGTHARLYVESGGAFHDITPIVASYGLGNNPLRTKAAGSRVIEVTDATRTVQVGDLVILGGSMPGPLDGIPVDEILTEHMVTGIVSPTVYEITVQTPAAAGNVQGGGALITASYALPIGLEHAYSGLGYGVGPYSGGTYGTPRVGVISRGLPRIWSLSPYGEDLVACAANEEPCYWDASLGIGARAVLLSNLPGASDTPLVATGVLVTSPDRHVVALGCNEIGSTEQDPVLVRWSDQENIVNWTPDSTTSAGGQRLSSGGRIMAWVQTKDETLIWTDRSLYSMTYSGYPYIFTFRLVGPNVSIIGQNAAVAANGMVFWMGSGSFFVYTGSVQVLPSPVSRYVRDRIDPANAVKAFGAHNPEFNEVWWFYQSTASDEIDSYVIYNYAEGTWSVGSMDRTAWIPESLWGVPLGAASGKVYRHETGAGADGQPIDSYIQSGDVDIASGDRMSFASRFLPDIEFIGDTMMPQAGVEIRRRDWPMHEVRAGSSDLVGTFFVGKTKQVSVRVRARALALRVGASTAGFRWKLGTFRLDVQPDGRK